MVITYSLSQLHSLVSQGFKQLFGHFSCYVQADISTIKSYKQRRYLTLIEPGQQHDIIASIKGIVFDTSVVDRILHQYQWTPSDLIGKQIKGYGKLTHHTQYGISFVIESLEVLDISVRIEHTESIIQSLQSQGIYYRNSSLTRPQHSYRIAMITGEGSEGCRDVLSILEDSDYRVVCQTFYCSIHGNDAAQGVTEQLHRITLAQNQENLYDIVMIVRGGGDTSGFSRQDNIDLAQSICLCPIPVMVAIGHTSNTSVLDRICNISAKTPSDAAYRVIYALDGLGLQLNNLKNDIDILCINQKRALYQYLDAMFGQIQICVESVQRRLDKEIESLYSFIYSYHPLHILSQGYVVITDQNGQPLSLMQRSIQESIPITIRTDQGLWEADLNNLIQKQ